MLDAPNRELRRLYEEANQLEARPSEISRVIERAATTRRRHRRGAIAATLAAAALSVAFVIPAPRDALDRFFNDHPAPGIAVGVGSLPAWLQDTGGLPSESSHAAAGTGRVLAAQDGQQLFAYRDVVTGRACFAFANDSDTCSDADVWRNEFGEHAVLKLASGVGPTPGGRVAVFGLARSAVSRVELRDGSTTVATAEVSNGGWVIVAAAHVHDTLVALDANGTVIESLDARGWTWVPCTQEAGCG
jgi:hypothetical protein